MAGWSLNPGTAFESAIYFELAPAWIMADAFRFEVPGNQPLSHCVEIMRTVFVCYHRYLLTHGEKASLH
jgi:hypothetical protein